MDYPLPAFEKRIAASWRSYSHSVSAAAGWATARSRTGYDVDVVLEANANRFASAVLCPRVKIDFDDIKAIAKLDIPVFQTGSFAFSSEIKPLQDAVLWALESEFKFTVMDGQHRSRSIRDISLVLSRRELGRVLDETLDIFRNDAFSVADFKLGAWFRIRIRDAVNSGRVRFRVRIRYKAGSEAIATTRDWTRVFVIHTGFSPPAGQFDRNELPMGGQIEPHFRSPNFLDPRISRTSRRPAGSGGRYTLEGQPVAGRSRLDDGRCHHLRRADRARTIFRPDRRPMGSHVLMGLRHQPRICA